MNPLMELRYYPWLLACPTLRSSPSDSRKDDFLFISGTMMRNFAKQGTLPPEDSCHPRLGRCCHPITSSWLLRLLKPKPKFDFTFFSFIKKNTICHPYDTSCEGKNQYDQICQMKTLAETIAQRRHLAKVPMARFLFGMTMFGISQAYSPLLDAVLASPAAIASLSTYEVPNANRFTQFYANRAGERKFATYFLVDQSDFPAKPAIPSFEQFLAGIFYVGKGTASRPTTHLSNAMADKNIHVSEKIKDVWRGPGTVLVFTVFDGITELPLRSKQSNSAEQITEQRIAGDNVCGGGNDHNDQLKNANNGQKLQTDRTIVNYQNFGIRMLHLAYTKYLTADLLNVVIIE
uniref:Uncharacterized protein n=1 Tax=Ditylenchus dipsaci TaxID=166011 RepID=A0A915CTS4_9BILA